MSKPCSALKDELPFTVMDKLWPLIPDPFHILDQHFLAAAVIQFCGSAVGVAGDPLGHLQRSSVF
jgi:hypothetical protein